VKLQEGGQIFEEDDKDESDIDIEVEDLKLNPNNILIE
jgi:hypothetical protein